jgi:hypothetical protein
MAEYDARQVTPHSWPPPEQMPDGKWMRTFAIRLREDAILATTLGELSSLVTEDVVAYMDAEGVAPTLRDDVVISMDFTDPDDKRQVRAVIVSRLDGWDDLLFAVAWRMFEDVDEMLGTICTIEGDVRDAFPPWSLQRHQRHRK